MDRADQASFQPQRVRPQLTKHQLLMLRFVMQGLSDREIAKLRQVSERSVNGSIHRLLNRLKAKNRAHAVYLWLTACPHPRQPDVDPTPFVQENHHA